MERVDEVLRGDAGTRDERRRVSGVPARQNLSLYLIDLTKVGRTFTGPHTAYIALRVPDVEEARSELEAKGVEFEGETHDSGVCHMAFFHDPDGNSLMLHRRYAPHEDGRLP